jgi:hypothetical protein
MLGVDAMTRRSVRRRVRPLPWRWIGGVVGAIAVLGGSVTAAWALPIPRVRPSLVKQLPRTHIAVPAPKVTVPDEIGSAIRYGSDDSGTVAAFDEARAGVKKDVDAAASRVRANEQARARMKQCLGDGLKSAGESYRTDVQEAAAAEQPPPAPDFTEVSAGTKACLQTYFPNEPEVVFELGASLANLAAKRAREAYFADPPAPPAAVIANWMTTTGSELWLMGWSTAGETPTNAARERQPESRPEPEEGSSFPWWALVAAVLVGGALVFAVRAKRS